MNNQYHQLNSTNNGGTVNLLTEMGFTDSMIKDMKNTSTDNVTLINFALSAQSPFVNDHDHDFLSLLNTSTNVLNNNSSNLGNNSNNIQQLPQIDVGLHHQNNDFNSQNINQNQYQQFNGNNNQHSQPLNQSSSSMYLNKSMDNSNYFNGLLSGNQQVGIVPNSQQQQQQQQQQIGLNQTFNNNQFNQSINGSNQLNNNNLFSVPHSPQLPQVENIRSSSNFMTNSGYGSQGINYDHTLPPIHTNISEPSSPINQPMYDTSSPPTSTNSSSSQLPKYGNNIQYQQQQQQQQSLKQPIFNPFTNSPPVQQPIYQTSPLSLPNSPPITNQTGKGPQIEIVNSYTQPFPIYTVKTHVLVPAPILKVVGYHGDANDLMIIANPEPDDSIAISQPAVTCSDGTFEFKFTDMHVDRKKHDPCNVFKLKFNLLNRKTFERFHEITSPAIELYYHTDMLPAPNIARLVPNSCYCAEEPEITVYGYYFKKGRSEILHVDFNPVNPTTEHRLQTIKQDDLHMPSQTSFSFSFAPPHRSTPGVYHVSARYTKTSTKKDRNQSNKSKVGNHQIFVYNELPENGSKRFKKSPIDTNGSSADGAGSDDIHGGYSYSNTYSMVVNSPSSPPTSSTSSPPPNSYYQNCLYTAIHEEVEDLEELLKGKSKEEINAIQDSAGNSLLMLASKEGRDDMVEKLLELGSSVELKNLTGHTVFHMACVGGNIDIVEQLVELGEVFYECLLSEKDSVGATALHIAVEKGNYRLVQHLLNNDYCDAIIESRDNIGLTPFHYAVQDGNQRITSIFIKYFLTSSTKFLNSQDYTGMTPLHWAAALGRIQIVKQLIDAGANLNIVDGDNESPIFKSIVTNNKEITKFLILKGTDPSIINNHSKSYIQLLAELSEVDNNIKNSIIVGEDEEEEVEQEKVVEEKEKIIENKPRKPVNVKQSSKSNLNSSDLLNEFSKLNIVTQSSNETPGNDKELTPGGPLTKFQPFKPTPGETFIPTAGATVDDFFSWTSRDITVNRFEILINQIEQNLLQPKEQVVDKTKKLTTLLQQSFTDKFSEWMNCEEELLATKRDKLVLEEELSVKAHEIIKLTDFIQSCPINLTEIKENTLGLFILKRERYFGFHQSETLVIVSNDSMQAIKKIYGNQLPSCLLANILFIGKTKSTKPSQIMPIAGTEFYVVDIEVQKQKGIVPE